MRNELAAIDFNAHRGRQIAKTAEGKGKVCKRHTSISLVINSFKCSALPTDHAETTNVYYKQVHLLICGTFRHRKQHSKRTKQWRPVAILEPKQYSYVPHLLVQIFLKRRSVPGPVNQRCTMDLDDPRRIASNILLLSLLLLLLMNC